MYLFLPGNNSNNKQWCEDLRDSYKADNKLMLYYDHWKNDGSIDWNTELDKLMALNITEDTYVVAKSAGCILALKAQEAKYIKAKAFVFIGFPYYWAANRGDNVDYLLENLKTKTLFIQKEKDPVIGFEELDTLLKSKALKVNTLLYDLNTDAGNTHDYKNIDWIIDNAENFIKNI